MYYCKSCGSVFSQAEYTKNRKYVCPDCGSKDFSEANQCKICKDYFVSDSSYEKYCEDCKRNAFDQFVQAVNKYVDPDYIELLRDELSDLDWVLGDNDG